MKDFDQFFKDRLEGERPHPRRDENWRQLSRRLDAFETGIQGKPRMPRRWTRLVWQLATGVAAAATITWVASQNHALRKENLALREQLQQQTQTSPIEQKTTEPASNAISSYTFPHNAPVPNDASTPEAATVETPRPGTANIATPHLQKRPISLPQTAGSDLRRPMANDMASAAISTDSPARASQTPDINHTESAQGSAQSTAEPVINQPENPQDPAQSTEPGAANRPASAEVALLPTLHPDSVKTATGHAPALPENMRDNKASMPQASAEKIIRPLQQPSRYRVGIQGLVGMTDPRVEGVSRLLGQSFTLEGRVWKDFWLGATVDLFHFEIDAKSLPKHFGLPENVEPYPPGGPVPHDPSRLVSVESDQKQRRFSAQLRYAVPLRGPIRPYVQAGHVWTQLPSSLAVYEFKIDQHHGGGPGHDPFEASKYFSRRTATRWDKNTWRLGAGVEYAAGRWAFGVSASYDKNFTANDPLFDAVLLKAGAAYQF